MVTDFNQPQTLIDAKSATYLISELVPSPMGGNLSAYASKDEAVKMQKEGTGVLLDFPELVATYKDKVK